MNTLKSTAKNSRKKAREAQKTNWLFCLLFLSFLCLFAANSVFAYSGGNGEPNTPYQIANTADLFQLAADVNNYDKCFILTADIDLASHTFTAALIAPDTNYNDDGFQGTAFTGVFDGAGHKITNLTISATGSTYIDYLGLFGYIEGPNPYVDGYKDVVKNLTIENVNITGSSDSYVFRVGGLAGYNINGGVNNCVSNGNITGQVSVRAIGGLVGWNEYGCINKCSSTVYVNSRGIYIGGLGGLVGRNNYGIISNCFATGGVSGLSENTCPYSSAFGGLVGENYSGTISCCWASGNITASTEFFYTGYGYGGLVGDSEYGSIDKCYATGNVNSIYWFVGGLVGQNGYFNSISNCYATGNATGRYYVGGLIGGNSSSITNCYSIGTVTGGDPCGGLVGSNSDTVTASFWDVNTSGLTFSSGGTGKTTVEMKTESTFTNAGWDFVGETVNGTDDIWWILESITYPKLTSLTPPPVSGWPCGETSGSVVYDSSGHGHDGNIIDATRINDPVRGQCLKFDGTNDYVSVPDDPNLNITGEITISAWIYLESGGDSAQGIVTKTVDNGAFDNPFDFRTANGYLTLVRADEEGHDYVYSTQQVPINRWHHVLVRVDRNNFPDFYIDGVVTGKTVTSFTRTPTANTNPVLIGKRDDGLFFKGFIDDVLIYNRALSDTEIKELYWGSLSYKASVPNPADNQIGVGTDVVLSWIPGNRAITHDLYFGTDFNEVNDATTTYYTVDANHWDVNIYNSNGLAFNTTYYWRIDEITASSAITKGDVWAFQTVVEPNLVNWWKFDEASGPTAYDSAGTNNGTITGATHTTEGKINSALIFNGSSNYVNCGSGPSNHDNITVSVWMKTSTQGALVSNRGSSGGYGTWYTLFSNVIEIGDNTQGGYKYLYFDTNDTNTLDNAWHHIVYTKNGTDHKIYVDGSLNQQFTSNSDISWSQPTYIGRRWNSSGGWFNGKIDDVRIYDRALSATEVSQLYQQD
jgi:hypothetical protein